MCIVGNIIYIYVYIYTSIYVIISYVHNMLLINRLMNNKMYMLLTNLYMIHK